MPRPISWLPHLPEIRRVVANSVRSHYGRRDLEQLFKLQPRAAQKLLELLPTTEVGTSRLVEREALAGFLVRVHEAEDVHEVLESLRHEKDQTARRRLRILVQTDHTPVSLASLPEALTLRRGQLEIRFGSLDELAETMYFLARALGDETEAFAEAYEPALSRWRRCRAGAWKRSSLSCGGWKPNGCRRRSTFPEWTTTTGSKRPYPSLG